MNLLLSNAVLVQVMPRLMPEYPSRTWHHVLSYTDNTPWWAQEPSRTDLAEWSVVRR